ncbi:MAG TPA: hypothetical protein GXZ45_08805 [Propionibacterium sp.]|nr:hypothetical protein [Propionibacterium sp.]
MPSPSRRPPSTRATRCAAYIADVIAECRLLHAELDTVLGDRMPMRIRERA